MFGDRPGPSGIVPDPSTGGGGRGVRTSAVLFALVVPAAILAVFQILIGQIGFTTATIVTLILSMLLGTLITIALRRRLHKSGPDKPGSDED